MLDNNDFISVHQSLSLLDPNIDELRIVQINVENLTQDIGYLLSGIQSSTFWSDQDDNFHMKSGVTLASLSPECLEAFCQDFINVGSCTKKLELLSSSYNFSGKVLSGFIGGIKKFLRLYTNSILTLSKKFSGNLGQLQKVTSPLMQQLMFLARMCGVEHCQFELPDGVSLLSKLLDVSVHVTNTSVNLLLISLLSSCSAPYLKFLKTWLFSGEIEGFTQEFGLEIDPIHINSRDEMYWKAAYNLIPIEGSSFLSDIQEKVHLTGKSVALLRLLSPDHHLAGKHRDLQPTLHLAVSADQHQQLQESCRDYEAKILHIAKECSESYAQRRAKEEEEKSKKLELILLQNQENKVRREKEELARREEKIRRQKQLYSDLQEQAREVKERKLKEKVEKEKEDKRIQDEAEAIENEVREREAEEKRKIEEFYEKLNAEADLREKRALWRMRRSDPTLKNKRLSLFQEDEASLTFQVKNIVDPIVDNNSTLKTESLKFELDDLGNVSVMVEDTEGNIVTEIVEDLKDIGEDVKEILSNDNFESLPDNTKSLICEKIQLKSKESSPFPNINTRTMNKDLVLGSQINFNYEYNMSPSVKLTEVLHEEDVDGKPRKKSSHGQQIERLLYPQRFYNQMEEVVTPSRTDFNLYFSDKPLPYKKSFKFSNASTLSEMGGPTKVQEPAEGQAFAPLTLILQNSILVPLRVQSKLVDDALLNHMLVYRQLTCHFTALRNYLLLADGEFGRQLVSSLCQLGQTMDHPSTVASQLHSHFRSGAPLPLLLSPTALNKVLDTAISSSVLASADPFSKNLTFLLDQVGQWNIGIPGLSLTYQASWPDNIVLSLDSVSKYSLILDFQLELRLAMLSLELDWANENLVVRREKKSTICLLHKVNLMRHEMMHFIRNLHDYVTSQVLEISWLEFQDNLLNKAKCLDDLIAIHEKYLNRALFRCLLNPKAASVMKILRDIFSSITKFSGMICTRMTGDEDNDFAKIEAQYKTFSQYSRFFFSLVTKLSARGYQPHLQDLLLRLNFNGYYT